MKKHIGYIVVVGVLALSILYAVSCGDTDLATVRDTGFTVTQSIDVFPLEREANEVVWVSEQSAFYTHGGDKGRNDGYTESDSGIYKYIPGSNPVKVGDLPTALHHIGFAYSPDTGRIYTYAGGVNFTDGGHRVYWFNPEDNTVGTSTEVHPYDAVSVVAEYSTKQKRTYLFGGFNTAHVYFEIWKHDPLVGTITKSKTMLPDGTAFAFQATVYVELEDAIYLFGGIDKSGTSRTEIHRFDCATEEIILLDAACPDVQTKGMGAYYDSSLNVIVLAGGRDGNSPRKYTARIWTFDLDDYSVKVLDCALPGFCDDLDGGYDPINSKGYFMRVTPYGFTGFSHKEPWCFGNDQKYICEVTYRR